MENSETTSDAKPEQNQQSADPSKDLMDELLATAIKNVSEQNDDINRIISAQQIPLDQYLEAIKFEVAREFLVDVILATGERHTHTPEELVKKVAGYARKIVQRDLRIFLGENPKITVEAKNNET